MNLRHTRSLRPGDQASAPQADTKVSPRRRPSQQRSRARSQQILDITAELLEEVGVDDLTTNLIAKRVGISVGSLYHYFPNKHAILYALGERWLEQTRTLLQQLQQWPLQTLGLEAFVDRIVDQNLKVYKKQKGVLPLVQAMFAIPELRSLDEFHDEMVITEMAAVFKLLGANKHLSERERIARAYLELTHALLLVVVNQRGQRAKRTLDDLKWMVLALLKRHLTDLP